MEAECLASSQSRSEENKVEGFEPVLVDDTGLAVHAWNGLPGALVAWFIDTVGPQGILDMATGITDRRATDRSRGAE